MFHKKLQWWSDEEYFLEADAQYSESQPNFHNQCIKSKNWLWKTLFFSKLVNNAVFAKIM